MPNDFHDDPYSLLTTNPFVTTPFSVCNRTWYKPDGRSETWRVDIGCWTLDWCHTTLPCASKRVSWPPLSVKPSIVICTSVVAGFGAMRRARFDNFFKVVKSVSGLKKDNRFATSSFIVPRSSFIVTGAVPQPTVTVNAHVAVKPPSSVALHTFVVTPSGNTEPLARPLHRKLDCNAQLSEATGLVKFTVAEQAPLEIVPVTAMFAGQFTCGSCASVTVTVIVHND